MTAEIITALIILLICALPIIVIGISQIKSKVPVGFWSEIKPPAGNKVSDINAYNKKHGMMWIIYGVGITPAFCIGMLFGGIVATCALSIEVIGGLVAMIYYHNYLDRKYVTR